MHGEYKMPGGKLLVIDLDVRDGKLVEPKLSGDFFLEPDSALQLINATLDGQPVDASEASLIAALEAAMPTDVMMYGLSLEAVAVVVQRALNKDERA